MDEKLLKLITEGLPSLGYTIGKGTRFYRSLIDVLSTKITELGREAGCGEISLKFDTSGFKRKIQNNEEDGRNNLPDFPFPDEDDVPESSRRCRCNRPNDDSAQKPPSPQEIKRAQSIVNREDLPQDQRNAAAELLLRAFFLGLLGDSK